MKNQQPTTNNQQPTSSRRVSVGNWALNIAWWMFPLVFGFSAMPLYSQTNVLPTLLPPYGELPPTFWEQHATSLMLVSLAVVVLAAPGIWLAFRSRTQITMPPETQARLALATLRGQAENGSTLVHVAQILRTYFIAAFQLPAGELTTTEFVRAIASCNKIDTTLAAAVAGLLHDCDARKFSPPTTPEPLAAVARAEQLVMLAEARRLQPQQGAETQTQGRLA